MVEYQKYIPEDKLSQLLFMKKDDQHWFKILSELTGYTLKCRVRS